MIAVLGLPPRGGLLGIEGLLAARWMGGGSCWTCPIYSILLLCWGPRGRGFLGRPRKGTPLLDVLEKQPGSWTWNRAQRLWFGKETLCFADSCEAGWGRLLARLLWV